MLGRGRSGCACLLAAIITVCVLAWSYVFAWSFGAGARVLALISTKVARQGQALVSEGHATRNYSITPRASTRPLCFNEKRSCFLGTDVVSDTHTSTH